MATTLPPLLSDQLPDDLDVRQRLLQRLQAELRLFGYLAISTPLVEHADLFLIKAGDAAINRLVSFDLAGHTLCIRPEFTAPAARVYNEHFQENPGAVRLQMHGPILQYESLKHGEITQRDGLGAELINDDSVTADAEVIALASRMLSHSDLPWSVTIGHSGLIDRFVDRYELDREMRRFVLATLPGLRDGTIALDSVIAELGVHQDVLKEASPHPVNDGDAELALQALMQATPQRGPNGGRTREEIARRLLEKQQRTDQRRQAVQALRDLLDILKHAATPTSLHTYLRHDKLEPTAARIVEMFALLDAYGVPSERIAFDLSFTRNLDYYTGVVFEFRADLPGQPQLLLGGGGRYDELIGLLGATNHVPAVGFMLYMDNILDALRETDKSTRQGTVTILHPITSAALPEAIRLATKLRDRGLPVTIKSAPLPDALLSPIIQVSAGPTITIQNPTTGQITEIGGTEIDTLIQLLETTQ